MASEKVYTPVALVQVFCYCVIMGRTRTAVILFFLTAILSYACAEADVLSRDGSCGAPCYIGMRSYLGIGECHMGVQQCANGVPTECVGQTLPAPEVCDNLDNNCNGVVDEGLPAIEPCTTGDVPFVVNSTSQCLYGYLTCVTGKFECLRAVGPSPEICNGRDDDCNGLVDDVPITELCYSGDHADLRPVASSCRAGEIVCQWGTERCVGEVLPSVEVCDTLDNDCNGVVDDVAGSADEPLLDILLVVDQSPSMADKMGAVAASLQRFISGHSSQDYRYALVLVPPSSYETVPGLAYDFTSDLASVHRSITLLNSTGGGTELSYDAFVWAADGALELSWRAGATHALLWYGDEEGQSAEGNTPYTAAQALSAKSVTFYGFVLPQYASFYQEIATRTGGQLFDLEGGLDDLSQNLLSVSHTCNGR